jgi:hypothetical protein
MGLAACAWEIPTNKLKISHPQTDIVRFQPIKDLKPNSIRINFIQRQH